MGGTSPPKHSSRHTVVDEPSSDSDQERRRSRNRSPPPSSSKRPPLSVDPRNLKGARAGTYTTSPSDINMSMRPKTLAELRGHTESARGASVPKRSTSGSARDPPMPARSNSGKMYGEYEVEERSPRDRDDKDDRRDRDRERDRRDRPERPSMETKTSYRYPVAEEKVKRSAKIDADNVKYANYGPGTPSGRERDRDYFPGSHRDELRGAFRESRRGSVY